MSTNVDNMEKYQKHYSEKGFWKKLGRTAKKAGSKVVYNALLLFYVLKDEHTPLKSKGIIIGALGYFILPIDLIPDLLPIAGFSDDLTALTAVVMAVSTSVTPEIKQQAEKKTAELMG